MLQTEYEFTLPKGYVDKHGTLHTDGVMRLATAADEILPQKDPRVMKNASYLVIILLSRVITRLGTIEQMNPSIIEGLFVEDLEFLENLYNTINGYRSKQMITCPKCEHEFEYGVNTPGEA